jgi:glutathione S-transferase
VFNSNTILHYLAEKTGKFLPPKGDRPRGELLSWLMFVATGVGPYSSEKKPEINGAACQRQLHSRSSVKAIA